MKNFEISLLVKWFTCDIHHNLLTAQKKILLKKYIYNLIITFLKNKIKSDLAKSEK